VALTGVTRVLPDPIGVVTSATESLGSSPDRHADALRRRSRRLVRGGLDEPQTVELLADGGELFREQQSQPEHRARLAGRVGGLGGVMRSVQDVSDELFDGRPLPRKTRVTGERVCGLAAIHDSG